MDLGIILFAYGILFCIFALGCIIGSFLNVVILRAFSGESIVLPPSKCPKCGNRLKWWHNIPILSYIFLRGKCGFCHEKISIQYPIVEFVTGCLFVAVFFAFGLTIDTLFALAVVSLLVVLSVTDIKERVVFVPHTLCLVGVGVVYAIYTTSLSVLQQVNSLGGVVLSKEFLLNNWVTMSIFGIIVGVAVMELIARLGYLFVGERAFGEGDSYIAAGLGAVFGWKNVLVILVMSVFIQLILTLPPFLKKLYCNGKKGTFASLLGFFAYVIVYFILDKQTDLFNNGWVLAFAMIILAGLGILACVNVIRGLKDRDNFTYLPFGPALAIAGLIMLLGHIGF